MSTPASLLSQGPTHWLHGLCGGGIESRSVASPRLHRKADFLGFPHRKMRSPSRSSQPRPGPPNLRPLASAFQPRLPSKCPLCPLLHPKDSDLGWDDVVSNIPEPLPKLRGVGESHTLDFGDDAALQGRVRVLVTLLHQEHPTAGRGKQVGISLMLPSGSLPRPQGAERAGLALHPSHPLLDRSHNPTAA